MIILIVYLLLFILIIVLKTNFKKTKFDEVTRSKTFTCCFVTVICLGHSFQSNTGLKERMKKYTKNTREKHSKERKGKYYLDGNITDH